mmetsp:Transcript_87877/g.138714  ORF Transcript_87877/g.138714 Transcript_87877/m.138714 type:complete len:273 (-) Transcript_87877:409-1227(-)
MPQFYERIGRQMCQEALDVRRFDCERREDLHRLLCVRRLRAALGRWESEQLLWAALLPTTEHQARVHRGDLEDRRVTAWVHLVESQPRRGAAWELHLESQPHRQLAQRLRRTSRTLPHRLARHLTSFALPCAIRVQALLQAGALWVMVLQMFRRKLSYKRQLGKSVSLSPSAICRSTSQCSPTSAGRQEKVNRRASGDSHDHPRLKYLSLCSRTPTHRQLASKARSYLQCSHTPMPHHLASQAPSCLQCEVLLLMCPPLSPWYRTCHLPRPL